MNKSKRFLEAHKMTREIIAIHNVDCRTQFAICLRFLGKEKKEKTVSEIVEMLQAEGCKIWEKSGHKRVYINNFDKFVPKSENPKGYRKVSMYYDVNKNLFNFSGVTSSMKKTVAEVIKAFRAA